MNVLPAESTVPAKIIRLHGLPLACVSLEQNRPNLRPVLMLKLLLIPGPSLRVSQFALGVMPWGTLCPIDNALKLYDAWKVDIWLEAKRQSDIDGMIALITRLPTFTQKPKPVSAH